MSRCKHKTRVSLRETQSERIDWCPMCGAVRHKHPATPSPRWKFPTYGNVTERLTDVMEHYQRTASNPPAPSPRTPLEWCAHVDYCNGTSEGLNKALKLVRGLGSVRALKE